MKRLFIAIAFVILGFSASAFAFDFLGWDLSWWGKQPVAIPAVSGHTGYRVSGGYYLLIPSHSQSYIQHP